MNLKLAHAISVLVVLFTVSFTAYGCENNPAPKTPVDPANADPAVIATADRILAELADASGPAVREDFRVASNSPDRVLSTASKNTAVSKWLEDRAVHVESKKETRSVAKHSHVHAEDIEVDMGGGWCDHCGCWMHHGRDPNGTPQSEIGHPSVCQGGATTQNCWQHYYRSCFSS